MRVKPIVKVMNFHALIRVDKARKKAEKYLQLEREATAMIDVIANNRNFFLDKKFLVQDLTKPPLNIYFGSDFGFCGNVNSSVNQYIERDQDGDKILIGKKLHPTEEHVLHKIPRDRFYEEYEKLYRAIADSIKEKQHREINIVYNHFYNTSRIEATKKKVFPLVITAAKKNDYIDDFFVEGNATEILANLFVTYVNYELKIAEVNSFASENILRQSSTSESIKKIEEMETEERLIFHKDRVEKEFHKVIDSYSKTKCGQEET